MYWILEMLSLRMILKERKSDTATLTNKGAPVHTRALALSMHVRMPVYLGVERVWCLLNSSSSKDVTGPQLCTGQLRFAHRSP